MKNIFLKLTFVASLLVMMVATGCDGLNNGGRFSASISEVGPEYVDFSVKGGDVIEMAYYVAEVEYSEGEIQPMNVFKKGTELTVKGGDVVRISQNLKENTQYYLYVCARISAEEFSKLYVLPFKTTVYQNL